MNTTQSNHRRLLLAHLARNVLLATFLIAISLYIGMLGYHLTEGMNWVDSFVNAAMILSGMGPLSPLKTDAGKIFAGAYALFSGLAFIVLVSLMFSPVIQHFFRKIHLENSK